MGLINLGGKMANKPPVEIGIQDNILFSSRDVQVEKLLEISSEIKAVEVAKEFIKEYSKNKFLISKRVNSIHFEPGLH